MATHEPTISFSIAEDREKEVKKILTTVYEALRQKGYNPINQIVGYIISEDTTYINSWMLYDMGFTATSPETFGWARP